MCDLRFQQCCWWRLNSPGICRIDWYWRFGGACCLRLIGIWPVLGLTRRLWTSVFNLLKVQWLCLAKVVGSVIACSCISWARALHYGLSFQFLENKTIWQSWPPLPPVFDGVPIVSWVEWGCHVCRPSSGTSLFISCNTTRWPWLGDDALLFISGLQQPSYL
jgi:hypothetical protein